MPTLRSRGLWLPEMHGFELRQVLEEILVHEARRDVLAAGQFLEAALGPMSASLGLGGGDQSSAAQPCKLGRVAVVLALGEGLDGRRAAVIGEDASDCGHQHRLAVLAPAVVEKDRLFAGVAGQAITEHPLKVGDQSFVAVHDPSEERAGTADNRHAGQPP